MTTNIDELPIPPWNLNCPQCGYLLNLLPRHQCPECGLMFDMVDVVPTWARLREPTYRCRELPYPDFGRRCAKCHTPLAGAPSHACISCGTEFDPDDLRPRGDWFSLKQGDGNSALWTILDEFEIPYIRRDPPRPYTPLGGTITYIPSEFYFDYLFAMQARSGVEARATYLSTKTTWRCKGCGETNPGTFELCWNCGMDR